MSARIKMKDHRYTTVEPALHTSVVLSNARVDDFLEAAFSQGFIMLSDNELSAITNGHLPLAIVNHALIP